MSSQSTTLNKKHTHSDLNEFYKEGEEADQDVFAEMRTNVLLVAGDHYNRRNSKLWSRIRESKDLPEEQKLRLTKNHVQYICKKYVNNITSYAPGVSPTPKNKSERQDQKAAELHKSVWEDAKETHQLDEKVGDWCDDFVNIGEVATKIFWNPNAGPVSAYEQKLDPQGQSLFLDAQGEETTEPMDPGGNAHALAPGTPVFRGQLEFEDIYGFNLLRPANCKNMQKAEWLGIHKMVSIKEAMSWVKGDEAKEKFIQPDRDRTYVIFDVQTASYGRTSTQVLIKEFYFRPCTQYPRGYYFISTEQGILFEGELPFGVFPIEVQQFDKIQTSPRGRSIIKVLRPYQVEINRSASKMAEHQVTLGDDKLVMQKGSKLENAGVLPGIRGYTVTGRDPVILSGRDGSQYLNYMTGNIAEMYTVAMVAEDSETTDGNTDPMMVLFKSASQRKRFRRYTARFENFLKRVCKLYLRLAKEYLPDDALIPIVGKREYVNIAEFRNAEDLCYQITIEATNDDLETKFGRMMGIQHALQYVGGKLDKEDIGRMLRAMPYANEEEAYSNLTLDYDNSRNAILALDRGEYPQVRPRENHEYLSKVLSKRTTEPDYTLLPPQTQQNYDRRIQEHEQFLAQQLDQVRQAEAGMIPTAGYMVKMDMYVNEPGKPGTIRRLSVPYASVEWLLKRLEEQGVSQDAMSQLDPSTQAGVAGAFMRGNQPGQPNAMGGSSPGAAMPRGAGNNGSENSPGTDYVSRGYQQPTFQ